MPPVSCGICTIYSIPKKELCMKYYIEYFHYIFYLVINKKKYPNNMHQLIGWCYVYVITKYYEFLLIQFFFYYRRSAVNAIARFRCSGYQMVLKYNILQGREEVSSCLKCISTIWDCLNVLYDDVWKIWCASPGLVPTSSTFNAVVPNCNPNKRQHILIIIICVYYTHTLLFLTFICNIMLYSFYFLLVYS